jgi:hypothetical protein
MNPITLHDAPDTCPRCGGAFSCGLADATRPCPCTTMKLSADTLAVLRQRYTGCLCLRCLAELASLAPPAEGPGAEPVLH